MISSRPPLFFHGFMHYAMHEGRTCGDSANTIIMSDQTASQFVDELKKLDLVIRLGIALLIGAFGLGVWVTTLEWRTGETSTLSASNQRAIDEMRIWKAETTASRFTLADFMKSNQLTTEQISLMDKRTVRLEDNFTRIEKTLEQIDMKLNKP